MSSTLYFRKVSKITEELPEIINTDENKEDFAYVDTERAHEWQKKIGLKRKLVWDAMDYYKAAEDKFGIRPSSMRYPSYYAYDIFKVYEFLKDGKKIGELTDKELEKYHYQAEEIVYLYNEETITYTDWYYQLDIERKDCGIVKATYLKKLIRKGMEDIGDDDDISSYSASGVIAVLKALIAVEDGETVVMELE